MERLKSGDICPICGQRITTEDPFILGFLTAVRELRIRSHAADFWEEPAEELRGAGRGEHGQTDR